MVNQLLDFTRTRLGSGFEIKKQRGEVVAFVQEILADFAVNHPERELVRDFPESVDADFDADRLRQAILNLLNNAGAYAPPKTPILTRIAREPGSSPDSCVMRTHGEAPRLLHAAFATTTSFDCSSDMSR